MAIGATARTLSAPIAVALAPLAVVPGLIDFANAPQAAYAELAALLGFAAWLVFGRAAGRVRLLDAAILALIGWAGLSLAWTPDLHNGIAIWLTWAAGGLCYFVVSRSGVNIAPGIFGAGVVVALVGLAQAWGGLDWPPRAQYLGSTLANPNMAAQVIVLALPFAFCLRPALAIGGIALMLCYLIEAQSRAAWLAVGVEGLVLILWVALPAVRIVVLGALLGLALTVADAPIAVPADEPGGQRLAIWANTGAMIAERPVVGAGLGGWASSYPLHVNAVLPDPVYGLKTMPERAHNDYLQLTAELGAVGVALLGLVVFAVLRIRPATNIIVLALIGIGVCALFSFPAYRALPPVLLGLALGMLSPRSDGEPARGPRLAGAAGIVIGAIALAGYHVTALASDVHSRAASNAMHAKLWPSAGMAAMDAWRLSPLDGRALAKAGAAYLMMRDYEAAAAALEGALVLRPNQPHATSDLAVAYAKLGRLDDAAAVIERARRLMPNVPELRANAITIARMREGGQ